MTLPPRLQWEWWNWLWRRWDRMVELATRDEELTETERRELERLMRDYVGRPLPRTALRKHEGRWEATTRLPGEPDPS